MKWYGLRIGDSFECVGSDTESLKQMEDPVVIVELPEGGRGRVVLDSVAGTGAGATAVVAMKRETGPAVFMTRRALKAVVPRER